MHLHNGTYLLPEVDPFFKRFTLVYSAIGWGIVAGATYVAYQGGQKKKREKGRREDRERRDAELRESLLQGSAAPVPGDEKEQARRTLEKKRRIRALAGGKTILTSEGPPTGGKTLLGS